jgi:hypothetical protein
LAFPSTAPTSRITIATDLSSFVQIFLQGISGFFPVGNRHVCHTNNPPGRFQAKPCNTVLFYNRDFRYSLLSRAMNFTLIPLGHAAWHS